MRSLAFPLRLQENGLLQRQDRTLAVIALLQMMARTPAGSWPGCSSFGLRDLFEDARQRADVARIAMQRINETFADLGLSDFVVTEVVRELSPQRDIDTYSIVFTKAQSQEVFSTVVTREL